jgi:hypothetical protein
MSAQEEIRGSRVTDFVCYGRHFLWGEAVRGIELSVSRYNSEPVSTTRAAKTLLFGESLFVLLLHSHRIYTEALRMPRYS